MQVLQNIVPTTTGTTATTAATTTETTTTTTTTAAAAAAAAVAAAVAAETITKKLIKTNNNNNNNNNIATTIIPNDDIKTNTNTMTNTKTKTMVMIMDQNWKQTREDLAQLHAEILQIDEQFACYSGHLVHTSESAVMLSKLIAQFYQHDLHMDHIQYIQIYHNTNEQIAQWANRLVQQQRNSSKGISSELDNWKQVIRLLYEEIEHAERAQTAAKNASDRLHFLKERYDFLQKKQLTLTNSSSSSSSSSSASSLSSLSSLSSASASLVASGLYENNNNNNVEEKDNNDIVQEMQELKERIKDMNHSKKLLIQDFCDRKKNTTEQISYILAEKHRIFDRIFIQLLECQLTFMKTCNNLAKPYQNFIDLYYQQQQNQHSKNDSNYNSNSNSSEWCHSSILPNEKISTNDCNKIPENTNSMQKRSPNSKCVEEKNSHTMVENTKPQAQTQTQIQVQPEATTSNSNTNNSSSSSSSSSNNSKERDPKKNIEKNESYITSLPKNVERNNSVMKDNKNAAPFNNSCSSHSQQPASNLSEPKDTIASTSTQQSSTVSSQEHNDFLFGEDFVEPTKGTSQHSFSQNSNKMKNQEPQDFLSGGDLTSNGTHSHCDFWDMFGNEKSNQSSSASSFNTINENEKMNSQLHNHDWLGLMQEEKIDSESQKQEYDQEPTYFLESIEDLYKLPKSISSNDSETKITQKARERIRFVQESYETEAKEQAEKNRCKDELEAKLYEWEFANGVRRNIRSLLTKLPQILWEDSGWKPVDLKDLLHPTKCRKAYQMALRMVHPDRAANRGDNMERAVICEHICSALNEAWKEFEKTL